MDAKISRIVINVGGKEVSFSPEEAKELGKILHEMFGEKETVYIPYEVDRTWRWYPPYPVTYWNVSAGSSEHGTLTNTSGEVTIFCNSTIDAN